MRIPTKGGFHWNLAARAREEGQELTDHDRDGRDGICQQVGPTSHQKSLWFVDIDVIEDCLTEFEINIINQFVNFLEKQLSHTR